MIPQPLRGPRAVWGVALALLLSACSLAQPGPDEPDVTLAAPSPALESLYNQRPDWRRCGDRAHCATVQVPFDWSDPAGRTWPIALTRRPATGERHGVVVINYGGPGVAGAELLTTSGAPTEKLAEHFDVVSFDPRGTGGSRPLECLDDAGLDALLAADPAPEDEVGSLVEHSAEFAAACVEHDSPWIAQLGTQNVVKDLDLIRAVLDQDKLNYLGYSYGTLIGALYAEQFGGNVEAMVLDGALDPSLDANEVAIAQASSLERALTDYVDGCLSGAAGGCPLTGDRTAALAQIAKVIDQATADRIATSGDRPLTGTLAASGIIANLYAKDSWPALSEALTEAVDGDGDKLLELADQYNDRNSNGTYETNLAEAFWAINCSDAQPLGTPAEWEATATAVRAAAPTLGDQLTYAPLSCSHWPVHGGRVPAPVSAPNAPGILVIGTTGDPATPYAWSVSLASQLQRGRLLTYDGEGHTVYGHGVRCIDHEVDRYFRDGTLPEPGLTCS